MNARRWERITMSEAGRTKRKRIGLSGGNGERNRGGT